MFERDTGDLRPEPAPWGEAEESPEAWTPAANPPQAQGEGNRPARHARQVESTSEVEQGWRGTEEVTDFLGLDQDMFGSIEQAAAAAGVAHGAVEPPAYAPAPVPYTPSDEPVPADGEDPVGWLVDEMGEETVALEGEEVDLLEGSWSESDGPRRGVLSKAPLVIGGVLAASVLVALAVGLRGWFASAPADSPADTREIARAPGSTSGGELEAPTNATPTTTTQAPDTGDAGTGAVEPRQPRVAGAPDAGPVTTDPQTSRDIVESIEIGSRDGIGETSVGADVSLDPSATSRAGPPSIARDPFEGVAPGTPGGATTEPAQPGAPNVVVQPLAPDVPVSSSGRLRYPTTEELAGIWQDSAIPLEAIDSPERIITPNVGRVRAIMNEGQVYEGRLYAVGQGKLWLDIPLGRMGLAGESLESVEHVTTPEGGPALGDKGSQEYAGLPRVRVRMPGGVFYGKLLHQDGDRVTLLTDEGGRVTLESEDIELAPSARRVTVKGFREDLAGG